MNETIITVVGNLTAEPELRQTQGGVAVASFTIASTPRSFDRQANEWKDGDALFMRCSAWRDLATNITGSLTKGMRVIASGRLQQREYQDREGNNRVSMELQIDEIGPSLRYATAQVTRGERSSSGGQFGGGQRQDVAAPAPAGAATSPSTADGWAAPGQSWSGADETPF